MNMLVDGEWRVNAYESTNEEGEFERQETTFRDRVRADPQARFPAEADRYHLYVARACPWAHGVVLARSLLGLEDVISLDIVDPIRRTDGWEFSPEKDDCTPDSIHGYDYLREVYQHADPDVTGRVTVPVLFDRERETIVNNESIEIIEILDTAFEAFASNEVALFPENRADEVHRIVDELYEPINNGVYRAGFARSQAAHETAVAELFDALEYWNDVLADRRYLAGEELTAADLRLFQTLVRFDEVYHCHFKCNVRRITDHDHLWGHTRELYQLPGVAETVNRDHIKQHYYRSHTDLNPAGLVPVGPDPDFSAPHDRDRLPGGPPTDLQPRD